jgi:hypothetical protein
VRGQRRDAEARANVERHPGQPYGLTLREDDVLLSRSVGPPPRRLSDPDTLADAGGVDPVADRVDRPAPS